MMLSTEFTELPWVLANGQGASGKKWVSFSTKNWTPIFPNWGPPSAHCACCHASYGSWGLHAASFIALQWWKCTLLILKLACAGGQSKFGKNGICFSEIHGGHKHKIRNGIDSTLYSTGSDELRHFTLMKQDGEVQKVIDYASRNIWRGNSALRSLNFS